jgi:hypothetical protein
MPVESKVDPFKPVPPAIPGVEAARPLALLAPNAAAATSAAPPQRLPESQGPGARLIGIAVAGGLLLLVIVGGIVLWRTASRAAAQIPKAPALSGAERALVAPAPSASSAPVGPGPIATVSELAKPWASKRFLFPDSVTRQMTPSMVVHLPNGSYWGFSLKEPFGSCELEFITDLKRLKSEYGFPAQHPMVADPCNQAVFDLMQYGSGAADDGLVRGLALQGSAIRPPVAIEIKVNGKDIVATRME